MASKTRLRIITPARQIFDKEVDMVSIRTPFGERGILPGHAPMVCLLVDSMVDIKDDGSFVRASVMSGFAEISQNLIVIVSDVAEWPDEIDAERAQDAIDKATREIESGTAADVIEAAKRDLHRAKIRLEVSKYKGIIEMAKPKN
ncbi:MAG: ATP synthase F1 subunit epsilon [Defluviitaleaceae bacterium]|nr:ATP synthase F1 subunit epsilon [Defluviitaleaceae bacterium]